MSIIIASMAELLDQTVHRINPTIKDSQSGARNLLAFTFKELAPIPNNPTFVPTPEKQAPGATDIKSGRLWW
jgi:hypothetical protein